MVRNWWGGKFRRRRGEGSATGDDVVTEAIGSLSRPVVVPNPPAEAQHVVVWIKTLVPSTPDRSAHEAALRHLLDSTLTVELPGLDYDMRWRQSWRTEPWESLAVSEAERLVSEADDLVTVAAGLSMHRNGRVREAAVRALDRSGSPRSLRWLVLRCGDWVPQVRDAARSAVEQWLSPPHAAELVDVLPILHGDRFGRGRPSNDMRTRIERLLRDPMARPAIEAGAVSPSRSVRRACVRLLIDFGADVSLLERAIPTKDVVAIAAIARSLPTAGAANRRTGELLFDSPMARFRAEGLWRLTKEDAPGVEDLVSGALCDPAPSVREVAQRWLSIHGDDPAEEYRAMLDTDPESALLGMGDRPDTTDGDTARRFLDDDRRRVKLAALRLLAQLGANKDGALFAERFLEGTAKERRYALAGLRRIGASRFIDDMWRSALDTGDMRLVERVVYQVLPLAGRWKRIDIGLQAIASSETTIREVGFEALRRVLTEWNRGYSGHAVEADALRSRLYSARPVLTDVRYRRRFPMLLESLESLLKE